MELPSHQYYRLPHHPPHHALSPHTTLSQDFDVIKKYYPHFWCGIAKKGSICYYEKCGYVDLKALKAAGVTVPQLIEYYTFMTEYMWNVIAPDEDGPNSQCLTIFDVKNVSLFDVVGEVLTFIKGTSGIAGAHYPERCANILIVNAPGIFSSVWKLIKPMIAPATQEKVIASPLIHSPPAPVLSL